MMELLALGATGICTWNLMQALMSRRWGWSLIWGALATFSAIGLGLRIGQWVR